MPPVYEVEYEHALAVVRRQFSQVRLAFVGLAAANIAVTYYYGAESSWRVAIALWVLIGLLFPLTAQREEQQAVRRATNLREEARVAADEEGRPEPFRYERLREVRRVPDREAYLLFTLFGIAVLGLRTFLASVDIASLGPSDAPAIMATVAGIPGLVIAVATLTPRWIRAWGAKAKDTGQGSGAAASGQADVIRAQKEGEAAVIRARAELMRAEAEYKRAEMGLEPLPPAQLPQPEQPLALPPARGNDSAPGGAPQLPPV